MDLAQLTNQPTHIEIGGKSYGFSEIPLAGLGKLQQWIKDHHPHPLRALQGHLDGFGDDERDELLRQAREEARHWPPTVGTARGAAALLSTEEGQVQALWVALGVHQPATTVEQAAKLYKVLQREAAQVRRRSKGREGDEEAKVSRIFAIAFGMEEAEGDDPKAS